MIHGDEAGDERARHAAFVDLDNVADGELQFFRLMSGFSVIFPK